MATQSRFYSDEMLLRGLNAVQSQLAVELILGPIRAELTVSRLSKICDGTQGATVPDDFMFLECGVKFDLTYVPSRDVRAGENYLFLPGDVIYTKGGVIYGDAISARYWAKPPAIEDSEDEMETFSDAFYHTVKFRAARDLVLAEDRDHLDRLKEFHAQYVRKVTALH